MARHPAIRPVTVVMLIPAIDRILAVDLDKILRMYTPGVYDTAGVRVSGRWRWRRV
ncbi:hypothetical protein [Streptomyces sp. MMBL 11-3]|uniref:hypothetical protein n=1 Tax=Streptomyces sp. MMBL 11-3 TaxID=3382639 RepID=UPI0039B43934